jgi:heme/copper-type cytochrome/quinol oxidase subunit 2
VKEGFKMHIIFILWLAVCMVLIIFTIIFTIKYRIDQNKETDKVKVGRNLKPAYIWIICSVLWIIIAGMYIYDDTEKISVINSGYYDDVKRPQDQSVEEHRELMLKKPTTHRYAYIFLGIIWLFMGIMRVDEVIFGRYAYITKNGVYFPGGHCLPDTMRYRINDSTLELYYKKRKSPNKYTIIEDREHLEDILSKSYLPG